jgi:hypothetical protein
LRDLRKENPQASEADLKEAVKSAVQAMINKARGPRRRADTQQATAESEAPRDTTRLPETRRVTRQDVPGPPSGRMLRGAESEVEQTHNYISRVGYNLHEAIWNRDAELIRSYRRALHSGIARAHETTKREAGARGWDPAAVDCMMREVEESTETLLPAGERVLMKLEEEARANWEERAIHQATQVTNLAGEAFETLSENRWSRRDCLEYQEELDWAMRTFRRICNEVDTASMSAKMRRTARARLDQVNSEYQRATRVVERLLQAHGGEYREEQKRRDNFRAGRTPDSRTECEDSIPMERRSTLPVNEILAAERRERSWESAAVPEGWSHPSAADRGREVGDLDMAGLNIGAPSRLRRGGRALPPTDASTPLGGDSGELPRTYSSSSARADYRRRLELNAQVSDEDIFFRREMNYLERGVGGFSSLQRAGAGESRGSPPVHQQDESVYATASEAGSERGRR